jgi:NAD(P)H-hydrate epimerase
MIPIYSLKQTKNADAHAINEFGIPSMSLMENAGLAITKQILSLYPKLKHCTIACGPGNNGGDGLVIARWLVDMDVDVTVILLPHPRMSREMEAQLKICRALDIYILDFDEDSLTVDDAFYETDLIVDALFGSGFKGEISGAAAQLLSMIEDSFAPVLSVDIPSGLDADTGNSTNCVIADHTIALETLKPGYFMNLGPLVCGRLSVAPVGLHLKTQAIPPVLHKLEESDLLLDYRTKVSHKGVWGKLMIIGGCDGFTGATFMATAAALKTGAGYVYVLHRASQEALFAGRLTEAIYQKVPETKQQLPDSRKVKQMLKEASAILIGPGLGQDEWSLKMLELTVQQKDIPVIYDGDALNLLARHPKLLQETAHQMSIYTPHHGEFCRLAKVEMPVLRSDPMATLQAFMPESDACILLKSHYSLIRCGEELYLNSFGNDGLAKAGSGDVLAGMLASFAAQGLSPVASATNASLLLGLTAEKMAQRMATQAITASGIIDNLLKNQEE